MKCKKVRLEFLVKAGGDCVEWFLICCKIQHSGNKKESCSIDFMQYWGYFYGVVFYAFRTVVYVSLVVLFC